MLKNPRGITLIALVITIIVLLILAGVSIAMLTGDNGILNQATRAKNDTEKAELADKINMALNSEYANLMADGKLSDEDVTKIATNNGISNTDFMIGVEMGDNGVDSLTITCVSDKNIKGKITYSNGKYKIEKAEYPTKIIEVKE